MRMLRGACTPGPVRQRVVPYLLYEDAGAAMDWLIRAFGFTEPAISKATGPYGTASC
jgi:hypothetical protein